MIAFAKKRAETLARTEEFKHDAQGYGENLAWNWSSRGPSPVAGSGPVKSWYDEIKDFDFNAPDDQRRSPIHKVGHFTQVVWKGSQKVGCAQAAAIGGNRGGVYTVCNYEPAGNYLREFGKNVGRP